MERDYVYVIDDDDNPGDDDPGDDNPGDEP
jgi:hypothetical protein